MANKQRKEAGSSARPPVLVTSHAPLFEAALEALLEQSGYRVITAETLETLLFLAETEGACVAVLDLPAGFAAALDFCLALKRKGISCTAVVLADISPAIAEETLSLIRTGTACIVPRTAPAGDLFAALESIEHGMYYIHPDVLPLITGNLAAILNPRGAAADTFSLTPRQEEVLSLLAEGLTNAEIAERLALSPKTVKTIAHAIYRKLGAHTRTHAVRIYLDRIRRPF